MLTPTVTGVEIEGSSIDNKDDQAGGATRGEGDRMGPATARTPFIVMHRNFVYKSIIFIICC